MVSHFVVSLSINGSTTLQLFILFEDYKLYFPNSYLIYVKTKLLILFCCTYHLIHLFPFFATPFDTF